MKGELLVGVRGLTDYLASSGHPLRPLENQLFWTTSPQPAMLDARPDAPGVRSPIPLSPAVALLSPAPKAPLAGAWIFSRRRLIWLEADVLIRQKTKDAGHSTISASCSRRESTFPGSCPTPRGCPRGFEPGRRRTTGAGSFRTRVYDPNPRAPLGGLRQRLAADYQDTVPDMLKRRETRTSSPT